MLGGDVGDAFHELLMFALSVVDERDRRLRDARQLGGLSGMVHTDLEHCDAMRCPQTEHRQRQADLIVEIAGGRKHLLRTSFDAQDCRGHLLDRSLAVAADDGDDRQGEPATPERGKRAQRRKRIGDREQAPCDMARNRGCAIGGNNRAGGTTCECLSDEIMAVEALALDRDE